MEVRFRTNHLRLCYDSTSEAARAWGTVVGRLFRARIQSLEAAETFEELFDVRSLRFHALRGGRRGQYAVDINAQWRLIVTRQRTMLVVEEVSNHYGD